MNNLATSCNTWRQQACYRETFSFKLCREGLSKEYLVCEKTEKIGFIELTDVSFLPHMARDSTWSTAGMHRSLTFFDLNEEVSCVT